MIEFLAGNSHKAVEATLGRTSAVLLIVSVLIAVLLWRGQRRRAKGHASTAPAVTENQDEDS